MIERALLLYGGFAVASLFSLAAACQLLIEHAFS